MDYDDLISGVKRYAEARSIRPETVCFYATCKAGTKKGGEYRTWSRIVCGTAHRKTMQKVLDYILREEVIEMAAKKAPAKKAAPVKKPVKVTKKK